MEQRLQSCGIILLMYLESLLHFVQTFMSPNPFWNHPREEPPCVPIDVLFDLGLLKRAVPCPYYNLILLSNVYIMNSGHLGAHKMTLEFAT